MISPMFGEKESHINLTNFQWSLTTVDLFKVSIQVLVQGIQVRCK